MKNKIYLLFALIIVFSSGCKKYLDVNTNPNGPTSADPALYLPPIQTAFAFGVQFDARALGTMTQNWAMYTNVYNPLVSATLFVPFEQHGYFPNNDVGGEMWRNVYWRGGMNMQDMKRISLEQQKWDIHGVALGLEAWGWQMLTDLHGEIILKEAFDQTKNTFNYDTQDTVYAYVKREALSALEYLNKGGDAVGSSLFLKYDLIYKGNLDKWKKFVYGLLAINAHHQIKKSSYSPDEVISYVDQAFASNADDALVPFLGASSADANFFGPLRSNVHVYGNSALIVRLTDGTILGTRDPRQVIMLAPSGDGVYRGLQPFTGQASHTATTSVRNLWGTTLGSTSTTATGRYLYQNNAPFPLMTYAQLQFIKAEAALKKGDRSLALTAYRNGINASLDFVRLGATAPGATPSGGAYLFSQDVTTNAAFDALKAAYLANPAVVPTNPANLTIQMIMMQKFIALWGYGFIETWTDLRKFDYDANFFPTFILPSPLFPDNGGKPAYRLRPRYNSEYIWNVDALNKIGGMDKDYQAKKMWIQLP